MVEPTVVVGGRKIFPGDLLLIRRIVHTHQHDGTAAMAKELCRCWAWRDRRGDEDYRLHAAERVLIGLAHRGMIELPATSAPKRRKIPAYLGPEPTVEMSVLEGRLSDFADVQLKLVEEQADEVLFDYLLARYHYLGSRRVIGEHLKYLAILDERPVAALLWGRAALKLASRDRLIGWAPAERREGIGRIANNYRFLILPWVRIDNLASHVMAGNARRISSDWQRAFGQALDCLETFVDPERFVAASYLAANWIPVGYTREYGRTGGRYHFHGHRKLILLFPLSRRLRLRALAQRRAQQGASDSSIRRLVDLPSPSFCVEGESESMGSASTESRLEPDTVEALAEQLVNYCKNFHDVFPRSEPRKHMHYVLCGLLSGLEKKNLEFMALRSGDEIPPRTLQHFLTGSRWSDQEVRARHQGLVASTLGDNELDACIIIDPSGFPKKGKDSAGVARQYCGATGKIDNCQVGVFLSYATPKGATVIDCELYMPERWFTESYKEKWDDCHIPEDLEFKTKIVIALELLARTRQRGLLPFQWVLADEEFGSKKDFRNGIPEGTNYFCEVASSTRVYSTVLGKPVEVRDLVDEAPPSWESQVTIKEGAHGPIIADVACLQVNEVETEGKTSVPGTDVWLFLRRHPKTGELKYYLSNAPEGTSLERFIWLAGMRWPIETCFQEGKDRLGMDHYQVRSWTGWHHHMTLVMLAHHFLRITQDRLKKTATDTPAGQAPRGNRTLVHV